MKPEEVVILVIFLGVIINAFIVEKFIPAIVQLKLDFLNLLYSLSWKAYLIVAIILLPFIFYLNFRFNKRISNWLDTKKTKKETIIEETNEIESLLEEDLEKLNFEQMKSFIIKLKARFSLFNNYPKIEEFDSALQEKLREAEYLFVELEHEKNLWELDQRKWDKIEEIKNLDEKIETKERQLASEENSIMHRLDAYEKEIFMKDNISEKEFKILLKNGFTQTNQYCVFEQKLITVLMKQKLNHSLTHSFLVWSVKRLLESYEGITDIKEHLSVDADITFRYNGKIYAIEIETGTLLGKKEQTNEKIKYLNKKYPNRWMIVVSNKDLIWRYRKLGFSTQRNEVEKNLQELLKNS